MNGSKRPSRRSIRVAAWVATTGLWSLPAIALWTEWRARKTSPSANRMAPALLLGCRPGPALDARADAAAALFHSGAVSTVIRC